MVAHMLAAFMQVSQEELRHEILHSWESRNAWRIPIELGPLDISITKSVWFLFIGAAITFLILFIGSRILKDRPGAYQVIVEDLYGFGRRYLGGQVGEKGMKWYPYTLSLFVFILVLNLIGLIPNSFPVTSSISFTLTLAFITFILTQYEGFRYNGARGYLSSFVPSGLPFKVVMVPLMVGIEFIQEVISKPLTLGVRLYANILAGHLIIFVFLSLILYFGVFSVAPIFSFPLALVFYGFEVFVAIIQAYIFAILTQVYIELAIYSVEQH